MKYNKLGIISYSNKKEYIGNFLEINNENFKIIYEKMNKQIFKDFKKNLNKFIYAIEINEKNNINIIIAYDYYNKWEFELVKNVKNYKNELFKITKDYILT